jgi:hypothetical protein
MSEKKHQKNGIVLRFLIEKKNTTQIKQKSDHVSSTD